MKYSRQREAIRSSLMNRTDHPTAETVYLSIKDEFPNISLGTVYRNLSLLADMGEILKISTENGPDRFDGNVKPHYHLFCRCCGGVSDLMIDLPEQEIRDAAKDYRGSIEGISLQFTGVCESCSC